MEKDENLEVYSRPDIIKEYVESQGLQAVEEYAFDKYVREGDSILDIGVGGGRTTPYLSGKARRYVGVDYSTGMVEACRGRFPNLEFHCADASDLGLLHGGCFDVVVFCFNGIDYIRTDEARSRCLREVARVLKRGGHFIFSSHNARYVLAWPDFSGATLVRGGWRIVRAVIKTVGRARRKIFSRTFWRGRGYVMDPVHGGLVTFVCTPGTIGPELQSAGFVISEIVGNAYPKESPAWSSSWIYYIVTKG